MVTTAATPTTTCSTSTWTTHRLRHPAARVRDSQHAAAAGSEAVEMFGARFHTRMLAVQRSSTYDAANSSDLD